jgi:predicted CXXCH cytochrome family protein
LSVARPWTWLVWLMAVTAVGACRSDSHRTASPAAYVGDETCAGCHEAETAAWRGSHHDRAMELATEESVLGNFDDVELALAGVRTVFFRRGSAFMVRTAGPDGTPADFEIRYTFGVFPLQQYLVPLPGGRLQALSIAWDSRPAEEGGQRWFHLQAGDPPPPGDPLHWTGRAMNWNSMCAECHSTNLVKGYDSRSGSYATTWSAIDVSCEACHGPAARHVDLAQRWSPNGVPVETVDAAARARALGLSAAMADVEGRWVFEPGASIAHRTIPLPSNAQVETCAHCHARRTTLEQDHVAGRPLLDSDLVSRLEPLLYHADGQIRDEVYVYGSFVQSRMYAAGVRCSDCHDPHTLALRQPGNALCAGCHLPSTYDVPGHHFHAAESQAARCVACHMPATTYMEVDPRRDHSMRIPRPHLAADIGTPDACTGCHTRESVEWAVAAVERWYGVRDSTDDARMRAARALHAGRQALPGASELLRAVADDPAETGIVRATALALAGAYPSPTTLAALGQAAGDPDPMVRLGAVAGLERMPPEARARVAVPLLGDSIRAVRTEAARVLAPISPLVLTERDRQLLRAASDEYGAALALHADDPAQRMSMGVFQAERGLAREAEVAYRDAIALDATFVPAYVNLVDLYRATGREADGEILLERALDRLPDNPALLHARGLQLVRVGRPADALVDLEAAALGAPDNPRYAYVLGVALESRGESEEAQRVLTDALTRHPTNRELLFMLAAMSRDRGDLVSARAYAERLQAAAPDDPGVADLVASLAGG